jgi:hypothetical protein
MYCRGIGDKRNRGKEEGERNELRNDKASRTYFVAIMFSVQLILLAGQGRLYYRQKRLHIWKGRSRITEGSKQMLSWQVTLPHGIIKAIDCRS